MKKPTVYMDTTIISAYWYEGENVVSFGRMQMAIASVHRIDYLLTWNYAHLANPQAQRQLEDICHEAGHRAPLMVTPESIPSPRRGQQIRRDKDADRR